MFNISILRLIQLTNTPDKEENLEEPCINCVDYTKGSLSDRVCDECHKPEYKKFLKKIESNKPSKDSKCPICNSNWLGWDENCTTCLNCGYDFN